MEVGITWGVAASASAAASGSAWSWCVAAGAGGVAAGSAGGVGGVTAGAARGVGITAVVAGALASFAAVVPVAAVAGAGAWLYSSMSCAGEASERESSGLAFLGGEIFGSMHRDGDVAVKRNSNGAVRREAELLERCQSEFVVQLIRSNGEGKPYGWSFAAVAPLPPRCSSEPGQTTRRFRRRLQSSCLRPLGTFTQWVSFIGT